MPEALKGVDFEIIRQVYTANQESLSSLAERFNIPLATLKTRALRGKWTQEKKSFIQRSKASAARQKPEAKLKPDERQVKPIPISEDEFEAGGEINASAPFLCVESQKASKIQETDPDWTKKQEKARKSAWDLAHSELSDVERLPVRGWKDADLADRMRRRAAGLDDDSGPKVNVLVNLQILNGNVRQVRRE